MSFHQYRMVRAGLQLTVKEMAQLAGVSHDTITRLEKGETLKPSTEKKVKSRLEKIGVEFIGDDGVRIHPYLYDPASGTEGFLLWALQEMEKEKIIEPPDFR